MLWYSEILVDKGLLAESKIAEAQQVIDETNNQWASGITKFLQKMFIKKQIPEKSVKNVFLKSISSARLLVLYFCSLISHFWSAEVKIQNSDIKTSQSIQIFFYIN